MATLQSHSNNVVSGALAQGSADDFIGGELWALNLPVSVYSGADTTKFVYSIPKNSFVGKIYSYVVKDGKVWWQIDNKNLNRFVKHEEGVFDSVKLIASLEALKKKREEEIEEKVNERKNNGGFDFSNLFQNLFGDIDLGNIAKIAITIVIILALIKFAPKSQ